MPRPPRQHLMLSGRFNAPQKVNYIKAVKAELDSVWKIMTFMVQAGPGENFGDQTDEGLFMAKAMVAFVTDDYGAKTGAGYETFEEVKYAIVNKLPIIPVKMCREYPPTPTDSDGGIKGMSQNSKALPSSLVRIEDENMTNPKAVARQIAESWFQLFPDQRQASTSSGGYAAQSVPAPSVLPELKHPQEQVQRLLNESDNLLKQGDFHGAMAKSRQALEADPQSPWANYLLGLAMWQWGSRPGAIQHVLQAREGMPNSAQLHGNLAAMYGSQGNVEKAFYFYAEAARLDPNDQDFKEGLAKKKLEKQKLEEQEKLNRKLKDIARDGSAEELRGLLKAGADMAWIDCIDFNRSALSSAAMSGNAPTVQALLDARAYPDIHGFGGMAPLHHAAKNGYGHVVQILLKAGANKFLKCNGKTPLEEVLCDNYASAATKEAMQKLLR
ncbi:ANKRD54 [Symbiodinium pilosum]|uniref:ANKRD54 protein n=1 Tax=Symbiodinium pilosum TaxID=2952 RepID=A0A812P489_SYMPI|nr:ANKRD54 [Symbiodinium pilosum]